MTTPHMETVSRGKDGAATPVDWLRRPYFTDAKQKLFGAQICGFVSGSTATFALALGLIDAWVGAAFYVAASIVFLMITRKCGKDVLRELHAARLLSDFYLEEWTKSKQLASRNYFLWQRAASDGRASGGTEEAPTFASSVIYPNRPWRIKE